MARRRNRPSSFPTWVILIALGILIGYGWNYYNQLQSGKLQSVLPARVDETTARALHRHTVAIISGHHGFDTGALCNDGLTEMEVNWEVSRRVVQLLKGTGTRTLLLDEYDKRLDGLRADVLISIHADSCVNLSGFKVARWQQSPFPARDDRLVQCLATRYAARTGLSFDKDTVTEDMTLYHAFRKVDPHTAAAIIEIGYLGGDRILLTQKPQIVATGIVEGIACYFERPTPTAPPPK